MARITGEEEEEEEDFCLLGEEEEEEDFLFLLGGVSPAGTLIFRHLDMHMATTTASPD